MRTLPHHGEVNQFARESECGTSESTICANVSFGSKPDLQRHVHLRPLSGGIAPWKAHEVRWPGMAATVKLSQQLRTESCVVPGNGHCEA